jgi:hypothetical protein
LTVAIALLVVTLLIDGCVMLRSQQHTIWGRNSAHAAILLALAFSQTSLLALASVARRARHRAWWLLATPVACWIGGMLFAWCEYRANYFAPAMRVSIVLLINAAVVALACGPIRIWRHKRVEAGHSDWRFGIKHFLAAAMLVALAGWLVRASGDNLAGDWWLDAAPFLISLPAVGIVCGAVIQDQQPSLARLAIAIGVSLGMGVAGNALSSELGAVRINAMQLAIMVVWLWLPRWLAERARGASEAAE